MEFNGERLEPGEVRFVERFLDVGETPEWIATAGFKPTNDFIWRSNGNVEVEQKTVVPRPQSIHGRIVDAASRAAKHGVVKDRFVIDIEDSPLTDEIRVALEQFNVGREKYRLQGLWVMAQGQLNAIDLQK
ncbi:hypothetical protein [Mycobacterium sp. DL440]|uniref:hypothetical protein n=1 Tax=Mycobacterium sp. DL440 TaxID=2675523 RepID=UPI00141E8F00|nr:hypothetical protein [Mycobacterium sp. DL440]